MNGRSFARLVSIWAQSGIELKPHGHVAPAYHQIVRGRTELIPFYADAAGHPGEKEADRPAEDAQQESTARRMHMHVYGQKKTTRTCVFGAVD
jgi:hypothetical protein